MWDLPGPGIEPVSPCPLCHEGDLPLNFVILEVKGGYHETRLPALVNGWIVTFSGNLQNTGGGSTVWGIGTNKNKHAYGGSNCYFYIEILSFRGRLIVEMHIWDLQQIGSN